MERLKHLLRIRGKFWHVLVTRTWFTVLWFSNKTTLAFPNFLGNDGNSSASSLTLSYIIKVCIFKYYCNLNRNIKTYLKKKKRSFLTSSFYFSSKCEFCCWRLCMMCHITSMWHHGELSCLNEHIQFACTCQYLCGTTTKNTVDSYFGLVVGFFFFLISYFIH